MVRWISIDRDEGKNDVDIRGRYQRDPRCDSVVCCCLYALDVEGFMHCFLRDARAVLRLADMSSQSTYASILGCTRHDQEALLVRDKIAKYF